MYVLWRTVENYPLIIIKYPPYLFLNLFVQISSLASSLSTRQLIRIAKRLASFPSDDLYGVIQKACLARYLMI